LCHLHTLNFESNRIASVPFQTIGAIEPLAILNLNNNTLTDEDAELYSQGEETFIATKQMAWKE